MCKHTLERERRSKEGEKWRETDRERWAIYSPVAY